MSSAPPGVNQGSAEKPPTSGVFIWHNLAYPSKEMNMFWHHPLKTALNEAIEHQIADVLLLSGCGDIRDGLGEDWTQMIRSHCGSGFHVMHQGHYTSIVRNSTVTVLEGPSLKCPLCQEHTYRMAQHIKIRLKDSVEKPIDLFNVHSPFSPGQLLTDGIREQILEWLLQRSSNRAFFGGNL